MSFAKLVVPQLVKKFNVFFELGNLLTCSQERVTSSCNKSEKYSPLPPILYLPDPF